MHDAPVRGRSRNAGRRPAVCKHCKCCAAGAKSSLQRGTKTLEERTWVVVIRRRTSRRKTDAPEGDVKGGAWLRVSTVPVVDMSFCGLEAFRPFLISRLLVE
ncbi:hypothetical protein V5799_018018 [Amblyomma americanum]|uniref:Uncharacterized protein n=1 Tax=Amblyomma americanum TaxID=6943 RepID=A0AAQ4F1K6_AMBAM